MRKICTLVLVFSSLYSFSQNVVISQVYGGGGNTGAPYNRDYVELHNKSNSPVSIANYSIQYESATGTAAWAAKVKLPNTSIPAGGYFLVQMTTSGTNGVALPTPDFTSSTSVDISATKGKVALVSDTNLISDCPTTSNILDLVGYGPTSTCSEGSPTAAPSNTTALLRDNNGCDDTNNNLNDFTVGSPSPRNSASPVLICGVTPSLTASTLASFGGVCSSASSDVHSFVIFGSNLTTDNITVGPLSGYTFSSDSNGTYSSTLNIPHGAGSILDSVFVLFTPGQAGVNNGNISVAGGGATTINVAASGVGMDSDSAATEFPTNQLGTSGTMEASIFEGCTHNSGYGFKYSLVNNFDPSLEDSMVLSTNYNGSTFSYDLTGLQLNTRYYYVAFVIINTDTVYSIQRYLQTTSVLAVPTVFTEESDRVTSYSATLHGRFISTDCPSISVVGIEYSPNPLFAYGSGTKVLSQDLVDGNFSSTINGLKQNTYYYYRSYIKSCNDSNVYGELKYFKTLPIPAGLTISANPLKRGGNVHYTLSGMKPGHYEIKLINGLGQLVLQKEKILQEDFMDAIFTLPGNITPGLYFFQVASPEFRIQKQVLVQ